MRSARWLLPAAVFLAAGLALRDHLPDPRAILAIAQQADPRWLAAALAAQVLSQTVFAGQQWAVLSALGNRIPAGSMLAITLSRSAISLALPAGSAASAAFAIRQYARHGTGPAVAAAAALLSALASVGGLVALHVVSIGDPGMILAALAIGLTVAAVARRLIAHHPRPPAERPTDPPAARLAERPADPPAARLADRPVVPRPGGGAAGRVRRLLDRGAEQLRQAAPAVRALRRRDWAGTVTLAAVNWLLDMVCLIAVAHACGAAPTWRETATIYLAVQVVRQIPLTPGGVGLVEAGLLAGLVTAGTAESTAAAVVLGYRLFSFWLVLPAGALAYLTVTRHQPVPARHPSPSPSPSHGVPPVPNTAAPQLRAATTQRQSAPVG